MHEVALCRHLAAAVSRATGERAREVEVVHVDVGQLRQVVPDAMRFAWTFVVKDTPLARTRLDLRELPAVLRCRGCGASARLGPELGFGCHVCGSADTELTSGEQFVLTAVDVRTSPRDADASDGWETDRGKGDPSGTLPST